MWKENVLSTGDSELYHADGSSNGYDTLDRLKEFQLGTLNAGKDSISGTASRTQSYSLDALGSFTSLTTNGTSETRSQNRQNQLTSVSGKTTPVYDANGNMTTDESNQKFKYDAWNNVVEVKNAANSVIATYENDVFGRRIYQSTNEVSSGVFAPELYYSGWQVIEERTTGGAVRTQYVWSLGYIDAMILRDRDTDGSTSGNNFGASGSGLDQRLYAQFDANFNVTSLLSTSPTVLERFHYDPYGKANEPACHGGKMPFK